MDAIPYLVDKIRHTRCGDGKLLAAGGGSTPQWCGTAAAAEAWALREALYLMPVHVPLLRTDCLSLLRLADAGADVATAPDRVSARIWCDIAHRLDGKLHQLTCDGKLVWMPSHTSLAAVPHQSLSNGDAMSAIDWRANRLADAIAKKEAKVSFSGAQH